MADAHDDYVWDHTGEHLEDSPLLHDQSRPDGSFFYNFSRQESRDPLLGHPKLTRRQAEYILRTFEDGATLIRTQLLSDPSSNEVHVETRDPHTCSKCFYLLERYSLIFTLVLQIINIIILSLIDKYVHRESTKAGVATGEVVMMVIELLNLVLVVLTSVKLGQQMYHHRVSSYFLAQCYLSSILLFAGLYALSFRFDKKSWRFVNDDVAASDPDIIILLFLKMLYLSISTATLCGSSFIAPREWYNYVFLGLQMLLSFVAFASILGQIFNNGASRGGVKVTPRRRHVRHRRPSVDSQSSRISVSSYGALDSTRINTSTEDANHK